MTSTINASTSSGIVQTADTSGVLALQTVGTTALTINTSQQVAFTNAANLPNTFGFKNRIINGAMMIDQRNAGASVTPTISGQVTIDRWQVAISQSSKFSVQQNAGSVTPPTGYTNYIGVTSLSAYSLISSDYFAIGQIIEGFNVADLGWGASGAAPVTLSFWVRSSLTGTFGGSLYNYAFDRSYPFSYTISSANTWTAITVTVPGDTTGTWLKNNSGGITIRFNLGSGSTYSGAAGTWASAGYFSSTGATSVVGTNGATFYITGVQLEKGSTATSFDYRPYGTELQLCQRYFLRAGTASLGRWYSSTQSELTITFPVEMRVTPSVSHLANYSIFEAGIATRTVTNTVLNTDDTYTTRGTFVNTSGSSGATVGNLASPVQSNIGLSAEL